MSEKRTQGTVLIVDDEPNVLWFISKLCQPRGYATLTATSGMEALKFIQECGDKIDLVLLDLKMPGMGGIEVLKSIRKHRPTMAVIVVTALHEKRNECEQLGIDAFVRKPYSLEELSGHIERVMDQQLENKQEVEIDPNLEPCAKVMVVDDEPEVCELLKSALLEDVPNMQFEVEIANSGDEALRKSVVFEPDIAIVDIKMPHMWGDELVRRFKAGEGKAPKDFVIYTSVSDPKEIDRAKKMGFKFLTKPTDLDTLCDVLKKICVRHQLLAKKKS